MFLTGPPIFFHAILDIYVAHDKRKWMPMQKSRLNCHNKKIITTLADVVFGKISGYNIIIGFILTFLLLGRGEESNLLTSPYKFMLHPALTLLPTFAISIAAFYFIVGKRELRKYIFCL